MLVFVYGTLQRGRTLHHQLMDQHFAGTAQTRQDYLLYRINWYPGLVDAPGAGQGLAIHGEVWDVDESAMERLDRVEEVDTGLYERRPVRLQPPFDQSEVMAYFYLGDVEGSSDNGDRW